MTLLSLGTLTGCSSQHVYQQDDMFTSEQKELSPHSVEGKVLRNNGSIIEFEVVNYREITGPAAEYVKEGATLSVDYTEKELKKIKEGEYIVLRVDQNVLSIQEDPVRLDGASIMSSSSKMQFSQFQQQKKATK